MLRKILAVIFLVKFSLISGRFVKIQPLPERLSPPKEDDTVKFKMGSMMKEIYNTTKPVNETLGGVQDQGRLFSEAVFDDLLKIIMLKNAMAAFHPLLFHGQSTEGKMDLNTGENLRYFGGGGGGFSDGFGGGGGGYGMGSPFTFSGGDFGGGAASNPMMSSLFLMGTLAFVTFLINSILGLVGKLRLPLLGTRTAVDGVDDSRVYRLFDNDPRNARTLLDMEQKIKEAIVMQEEKNMKSRK